MIHGISIWFWKGLRPMSVQKSKILSIIRSISVILSGILWVLSGFFWVLTFLGRYRFFCGSPLFYTTLFATALSLTNLIWLGSDKKWGSWVLAAFIVNGLLFTPFCVTAIFFLCLSPIFPGIGSDFFNL